MDQPMKPDLAGALRMGAAFAVGYVLGRSHRSRLAAGVGLAIVMRGVGGGGLPIGGGLTRSLTSGPLGKVAEEVAGTVSQAAAQAFNARVERMADALHERTSALQPPVDAGEPDAEEAGGEEPEVEDEEQDAEEAGSGQTSTSGRPARARQPQRQSPSGRRQQARG
jgi:hypothetical protein